MYMQIYLKTIYLLYKLFMTIWIWSNTRFYSIQTNEKHIGFDHISKLYQFLPPLWLSLYIEWFFDLFIWFSNKGKIRKLTQ